MKKPNLPQSPGKPSYLKQEYRSKNPQLTPDVYKFLLEITKPAMLDHKASHADMIRNVVLEDLQRRIHALYSKTGI